MVDVPDRIRVAQDADGFWTCREAISGSQEYVRADLYAALEAKLAARSGAVKALIAELERMTEDELILLRLEASDEIAALLAALEPAEPALATRSGAVKVKALEWEETHSGGFEADSALGYYKISMGFGSDAYYWAVTNPLGDDVGSAFEDPSYAKAAAQQDYERRILSALEPAEPAPAAEPVACVERGSEQSTPQPESRLREALEGIDSIITNSINENGSDYHRMKIGEDWYDGPVVDALHKILMGLREIARTALAQGGR